MRRTEQSYLDRIREDLNLKISIEKSEGKREGALSDNSDWAELRGQSGGGIFCIKDEYLGLLGIQNKVPNKTESKGRIEFSPLHNFDEIINESNEQLETLFPYYMKCFSFLKDDAFKLEVEIFDEKNIEFTRNYLKNKAHEVISSGVTPLSIKNLFKKRLLVNDNDKAALNTQAIWRLWLEFLTVINIAKDIAIDKDHLNEIFNSFRLKYSNTKEDWTYLVKKELLYSDYIGLKSGASIFIGTPNRPINALALKSDKIRDIATVYDSSKFKTDKGLHPYTSFTFIHTDYLSKNCIIDKLNMYKGITDEGQLLLRLKDEYSKLFK